MATSIISPSENAQGHKFRKMTQEVIIINTNSILVDKNTPMTIIQYMSDILKPLLGDEASRRLVFLRAFVDDQQLAKEEYILWEHSCQLLYIQIVKWMNDPSLTKEEFLYLHNRLYDFLESLPSGERQKLLKIHPPRPRRFRRRETL